MSILTELKNNIVINTPDSGESLQSILSYISVNVHRWQDKNTLWDVRAVNFNKISIEALKNFSEDIQSITKVREGLKTAFVVDSDLAFGMVRILQLKYNEKINIIAEVFKNIDDAFKWLEEE